MKVLKNVLKIFGIIFFIVIPAILILYNIFFGFMGCYITINNNNTILETLLEEEKIDNQAKIILLPCEWYAFCRICNTFAFPTFRYRFSYS